MRREDSTAHFNSFKITQVIKRVIKLKYRFIVIVMNGFDYR